MKDKLKTEDISKEELARTLFEVLCAGYSHIHEIRLEMSRIKGKDVSDLKDLPEDKQKQMHALTLVMTTINDLLHPAHNISYKLFTDKEMHKMIDLCKQAQVIAFKDSLVDPCKCSSCAKESDGREDNQA